MGWQRHPPFEARRNLSACLIGATLDADPDGPGYIHGEASESRPNRNQTSTAEVTRPGGDRPKLLTRVLAAWPLLLGRFATDPLSKCGVSEWLAVQTACARRLGGRCAKLVDGVPAILEPTGGRTRWPVSGRRIAAVGVPSVRSGTCASSDGPWLRKGLRRTGGKTRVGATRPGLPRTQTKLGWRGGETWWRQCA